MNMNVVDLDTYCVLSAIVNSPSSAIPVMSLPPKLCMNKRTVYSIVNRLEKRGVLRSVLVKQGKRKKVIVVGPEDYARIKQLLSEMEKTAMALGLDLKKQCNERQQGCKS